VGSGLGEKKAGRKHYQRIGENHVRCVHFKGEEEVSFDSRLQLIALLTRAE
jgi:hypothetical protein